MAAAKSGFDWAAENRHDSPSSPTGSPINASATWIEKRTSWEIVAVSFCSEVASTEGDAAASEAAGGVDEELDEVPSPPQETTKPAMRAIQRLMDAENSFVKGIPSPISFPLFLNRG